MPSCVAKRFLAYLLSFYVLPPHLDVLISHPLFSTCCCFLHQALKMLSGVGLLENPLSGQIRSHYIVEMVFEMVPRGSWILVVFCQILFVSFECGFSAASNRRVYLQNMMSVVGLQMLRVCLRSADSTTWPNIIWKTKMIYIELGI